MASHKNFWFSTCPTKQTVSAELIRNADVLIIGGGIAGISALYQLVNAGINAYLVEESSVGFHASGRSSGQLMLRGHRLFHEYGEFVGADYLKFVAENNRRFLNGLRVATFDTDLRESGGLRLAATDEELDKLEIESNFIEDTVDITCPILSKKEVQSILPKTGFAGGMYIPTEATFNPYKIVNGLREWIERKSSRILTDCQVTRVEDDGKGFAVSILHKGTIKAKKIVYCTNAYIPELIPELKDDITPFRGQIVVTDHLDDSISQLLPSMSMSCNNGSEYFRTYGGRLLVGGMRHAVRGQQVGIVNDGEVSPAIYDRLRGFVSGALPFIQNAKFTHTWSGIMCTTSDRLPLIGPRNDKLNEFILGGFNGYGFSHALYGSMIIKNFIESGFSIYTGAEIFDPRRFQNDL